jgi:hypothetical protein
MLLGAGIPLGRTLFWPQSTWRKHWAESSHSALRPARFSAPFKHNRPSARPCVTFMNQVRRKARPHALSPESRSSPCRRSQTIRTLYP